MHREFAVKNGAAADKVVQLKALLSLGQNVAVKTTFTNIPIVTCIFDLSGTLSTYYFIGESESEACPLPANSRQIIAARTDKWKGVDTSVKKCHVGIRYKQEEGDLAAQVRCESSVKFAGSIQKTTYSRQQGFIIPHGPTSAPSGHDAPTVPTVHHS
eukprot:scaffold6077_cov75-Skeletonema_menzelii.AAC.2